MNWFTTCLVPATTVAMFSLAAIAAQQPATPAVPAASPKQALAEARALAGLAKGKTGPERATALEAGARAYQQLATTFSADAGIVAEASYEAAELWRRKGALADAEAAYRVALEHDPSRYEARAAFELAHLLRRGKKTDAAVDLYRKVASLQPGSARAHSALVWIGRTQQAANKLDEAIAAFEVALQSAPTPAALISAGNWQAKAKIKKGDYEGARVTIADVDQRVANDVVGDSPAGKRLQAALVDMSARRALQRTLDKKTNASADALDVENVDADEEENRENEEVGNGSKPAPKKPDGKKAGAKGGR